MLRAGSNTFMLLDQGPGECVHIPRGWWHATLCLELSAALTQNTLPPHNAKKACARISMASPPTADALRALINQRHADD